MSREPLIFLICIPIMLINILMGMCTTYVIVEFLKPKIYNSNSGKIIEQRTIIAEPHKPKDIEI